jgi:1,4-dihydroxy-6-naphthoate synthase
LSTGAALGFGCGPVVVGKKAIKRSELLHHRIAIPGQLTTAHLLFQLWAPEAHHKLFVTYDQIFDLLLSGEANYGVLIHESRFTYEQTGFQKIVDLGDWWEKKTSLPIPLGCIAICKKLPVGLTENFESLLKMAINNSLAYPERTFEYIRQYAQEMDKSVLNKHIRTFVNQYSLDLGDEGRAAVAKLEEMALNAGIIE